MIKKDALLKNISTKQLLQSSSFQATHEQVQTAIDLLVRDHPLIARQLLKNPKATLKKELGILFDKKLEVEINYASEGYKSGFKENTVFFLIPKEKTSPSQAELSNKDLESISGGIQRYQPEEKIYKAS